MKINWALVVYERCPHAENKFGWQYSGMMGGGRVGGGGVWGGHGLEH